MKIGATVAAAGAVVGNLHCSTILYVPEAAVSPVVLHHVYGVQLHLHKKVHISYNKGEEYRNSRVRLSQGRNVETAEYSEGCLLICGKLDNVFPDDILDLPTKLVVLTSDMDVKSWKVNEMKRLDHWKEANYKNLQNWKKQMEDELKKELQKIGNQVSIHFDKRVFASQYRNECDLRRTWRKKSIDDNYDLYKDMNVDRYVEEFFKIGRPPTVGLPPKGGFWSKFGCC